MKKFYYVFPFIVLLFISGTLFAQQNIQKKIIPHDAAKTVNFKDLADFERSHPIKKHRFIEQGEDVEEKFLKKRRKHKRQLPAESKSFKIELPSQNPAARMATVASPAPNISFNGILDNNSVFPPDIEGAAGPSYLVETTNQEFDIFSKNGTLVSTLSPYTLFASTGGDGYFDPHVMYDRVNGHFLLCCGGNLANGHGAVFLAVSQTTDPIGNWYVYGFDGSGNTTDLLDFPMMGFNANWVVITVNDFNLSNGNFNGSKVFVFNRANVYSGSEGTVSSFTDVNIYSTTPAQTYDASQTTEYLVADYDGDLNNAGTGYMQIGTITGSANSPSYASGNTIGVNQPWDENPVGAVQKGNSTRLEDGDTRVGGGATYIGGHLWFSHTVFLPAGSPTHDAVDWWQVDPVATTVTQFGRIDDPSGVIFNYYPSIDVNAKGDALMGYCQSSTNMYVSSAYSLHLPSDASGVMESTYIYKNGVSSYVKLGDGRNRWGDFTGLCVDPSDSSFWYFSQWANTNNNWGTVVADVLGPCSTPVGLVTINITDSSATFSWNAVPNASSYSIQYRVLNTSIWTTVSTSSTSITINGLSGTTRYEWRMPLVCTNSSSNSFTSSVVFQTLTPCPAFAPSAPSSPINICSGDSASLSVTGVDTVYWYPSAVSNTVLSKGKTYKTLPLTKDTSFYAQSIYTPAAQHDGPADNTFGSGSYFTNTTTYRDIVFDCYAAFRLLSVKVYAQGTSTRTITLKDQSGNTLASQTISIPDGASRVTLNFNVPIGVNLELGIQGNVNLFRDSTGASFPYTLSNVLSITGTNATGLPGYYYYFYDWIVQLPSCSGPRTAVNVNVSNPVASFTFQAIGDSVVFTNHSTSATSYTWLFGDSPNDTTSAANPSHKYPSASATYSVTLIACHQNNNCCDVFANNVPIIPTSISSFSTDNSIKVYPNPIKDNIYITFGNGFESSECESTLTDLVGQVVLKQSITVVGGKEYSLDTSRLASGIYMLSIQHKNGEYVSRIVKE